MTGQGNRRCLHLAAALLLASVPSVQGAIIVDQVNGTSPDAVVFLGGTPQLDFQQEIIAGVAGQLVGFDMILGPGTYDVFLNLGVPWQIDADIFTATVTKGTSDFSWTHFDTSLANIQLAAGDQFVIGVYDRDESSHVWGTLLDSPLGAYDGRVFVNGSPLPNHRYDMSFRTYMQVPDQDLVPEPSTLFTFTVLGITWLAARRRIPLLTRKSIRQSIP